MRGSSKSESPYSHRSFLGAKKKVKKCGGLGTRKSSIKSTLRFHMSGSEDEQSLERIHTFNLKSDLKELSNLLQSDYSNNEEQLRSPKSPLAIGDFGIQSP